MFFFFATCSQLVCDYKSVSRTRLMMCANIKWRRYRLCLLPLPLTLLLLLSVYGIYDAYLWDTFHINTATREQYTSVCLLLVALTFSTADNKHYTHRCACVCASVCGKCAFNCEFNELFTFLCACWHHSSPSPLPSWPSLASGLRFNFSSCFVLFMPCFVVIFAVFSADFIYNSCAKLN